MGVYRRLLAKISSHICSGLYHTVPGLILQERPQRCSYRRHAQLFSPIRTGTEGERQGNDTYGAP